MQLHTFADRTTLLLALFAGLVLVFFSLSTNQEYYTFPAYLPLLLLTAVALTSAERNQTGAPHDETAQRVLLWCHMALLVLGLLAAVALGFGLWSNRHLPAAPNVGDLLAHRGVGNYTLSMSRFFDLTGASFSALRLPASLACVAFALGPVISLILRRRGRAVASTVALGLMSTLFFVAAHLALERFGPMLSSANFARTIEQLERTGAASPDSEVLIYGDQAFGSSIPFYLRHRVELVDGRSTSMLFGSTFPDVPPVFITHEQLLSNWGRGPRKLLFVPLEQRAEVDELLGSRQIILYESSGKGARDGSAASTGESGGWDGQRFTA